jgi:competence protein ComEC
MFLRIPRRISLGISCVGVVFFIALTGFEPSILRAGFMCLIFLAGQMIGREPDSLNSLGISVFAITVGNPYAVNDVGLLLSFAATYGLLVLYPYFKRATTKRMEKWVKAWGGRGRFLEKAVDSIIITVAATIPTLPVILIAFGQISLISPLANLLMVFPTSVVMVTACAAVPFYYAGPLRFVAAAAFQVAKVITRYLISVAEWLTSVPFASIWARQTFLIILIPAAIGLIVLGYRLLGRHGTRIAAIWSVVALLCGVLSYQVLMKGVTEITIISAGNATALLLERDGRTGVILMGDESSVTGSVRELERRSVRTVDFLMIPDQNDGCAFAPMILTERIGVPDCGRFG